MTPEVEELWRRVLNGELKSDEAIEIIKSKYTS